MRLQGKRIIGGLWRLVPASKDRRVVLIYHAVGTGPLSLCAARFEEQMAWLNQHARVLPLDALLGEERGGLRVALTFDDGYRSLYRVVAPVLERYRFPATVYLNTGWAGESTPRPSDPGLGHYPGEEFLLWREAEELAQNGWYVGSHGIDHVDLTALPLPEVERQLRISREEIEGRLGQMCRHFAYTWGRHNPSVLEALPRTGYRHAAAAHHAALSAGDHPFAFPRVDVRREYTLSDFLNVVTGAWDYLGILHRLKGCR